MHPDFLVHIDTLGLKSNAALIGLGALSFNLLDRAALSEPFYCAISSESNGPVGREVDLAGIDHWRFDAPYLDPFTRDMTTLEFAIEEFVAYYQRNTLPEATVWLWSGSFEGTILQTTFEALGTPLPWPYYAVRDAKTFCATADTYGAYGRFVTPHGRSPEDQMRKRTEALRTAHEIYSRCLWAQIEEAA